MDQRTVVLIFCCSVLLLPPSEMSTTAVTATTTTNTTELTTSTPAPTTTTTVSKSPACDDDSGVGRGIGIGIGIMLCIIAAVAGALVLVLWRRGWTLPWNTDLSSTHGDTKGTVTTVNTKTLTRHNQGNSDSSPGNGAANIGNYNRFHSEEADEAARPAYTPLQQTASVDPGVYEDPDKKRSVRSQRPKSDVYEDPEKSARRPTSDVYEDPEKSAQRPTSDVYEDPEKSAQRPMSDVYVEPEKAAADNSDTEDYVEPMTTPGRVHTGPGTQVPLPERVSPEGKRRSSLFDDGPGDIYQNSPPRPRRNAGATRPADGVADSIYIDMDVVGRQESVYMNTN